MKNHFLKNGKFQVEGEALRNGKANILINASPSGRCVVGIHEMGTVQAAAPLGAFDSYEAAYKALSDLEQQLKKEGL